MATGASIRISPRRTASAMTRPVIALVIDPTSIERRVVGSDPGQPQRLGSVEVDLGDRDVVVASHVPPAGLLVQVPQDGRITVSVGCQVRGHHPGDDDNGQGGHQHGEHQPT